MRTQATTPAAGANETQARQAVTTRSTSAAQSKSNTRLLIFTILSTALCLLALANVASADPSSAEDQYVEKAPTGGGDTKGDEVSYTVPLGSTDGTVSEEDVEQAAKKKKEKKDDSDEGPSGGGAAAGGTGSGPPPAAAAPVAAASKSPLSTPATLALGAMVLALGGAGAFMHFRKPPIPST